MIPQTPQIGTINESSAAFSGPSVWGIALLVAAKVTPNRHLQFDDKELLEQAFQELEKAVVRAVRRARRGSNDAPKAAK